ncbi:MAG: hypothetical protein O2779_05315 [Nanoarchaeota archaeon]|nr:hypothetical protein [Nanoarchaeota archaeon]
MVEIIGLDECVLSALKLFIDVGIPELHLGDYKRPLVVGSGNAAATGKIILEGSDAVFADEGTYLSHLGVVDGAILISASGGKHAPIIATELKKREIETRLLTCNKNAEAKTLVKETFVFPKQAEPYTYNTSTYMSMILGKTKEDPKKILDYITTTIVPLIPTDFKNYTAFYLIVPARFDSMREMLLTKFDELFGSMVNGRVFTVGQTKHAKTVIANSKELFISFGEKNTLFGEHRLDIPLPADADYAALMAIGYFVIGNIQKQHPAYFKDNIEEYVKNASNLFGSEIKALVE